LSSGRSLAVVGLVILVVSALFPWFTIEAPFFSGKIKLNDLDDLNRIVERIVERVNPVAIIGREYSILWFGYGVVVFLALIGLLSRYVEGFAGVLGLLLAAYVYNNLDSVLFSDVAYVIKLVVSTGLDIGFYLFLLGCFIMLIAAAVGYGKKKKE